MSERDKLLADPPGTRPMGDNEAPPPYQQQTPLVVYQQPPADAVRHTFFNDGCLYLSHTIGRSKEKFDSLFSVGHIVLFLAPGVGGSDKGSGEPHPLPVRTL